MYILSIYHYFQLDLYLKRIGFDGEVAADSATLKALMQQQLRSVPFENLDVQAGKIVSLNPEDIVSKIIGADGTASRGGYCYEVNALFAMALTALSVTDTLGAEPSFQPRSWGSRGGRLSARICPMMKLYSNRNTSRDCTRARV